MVVERAGPSFGTVSFFLLLYQPSEGREALLTSSNVGVISDNWDLEQEENGSR